MLIAKKQRYLLDTTLRDGEQAAGVCFSAAQKIKIAALLDDYGVCQVEAGVPAASSHEKDIVAVIMQNRKNALVSVWSRLLPTDIKHAIDVKPDVVHFSVPVSQIHIHEKLRKDKAWVLAQLKSCLTIIDKSGINASVGFEDAFRADKDFMKRVIRILIDNGVTRIRLSDTVGVTSPTVCRMFIEELIAKFGEKITFGIHAHNDLGMAIANTIEAAKSGCLYADVTAGGIGERAGNCDLSQLVCASESIFDWGISANKARELQKKIKKIINSKE